METVNGVTDDEKGGPPPPSPLTGCYLLIVVGEPHSDQHKDIILQRIAKGLLSWDLTDCLVDLEKELAIITEQALEGEEARYGERLIQFASENLVTEILIHPVVSTLAQCMRNLLSSFTRHRHIIHAGYTFAANGSWALQDGTFSSADFAEAFQELEVQRVIRAYENGISLDLHCSPEGDWSRLPKEHFAKACKVRVNPTDVLTTGCQGITEFINYISPFLSPTSLENLLESSDVVGNIRFSRPTLYVFPGGQGDAALFGINGFNMLLDGGFSRKACFWDFVRHLDRLDAVLMTRLNNSNVGGISSVLRRKKQDAVYPQIGHFFCNIQERKALLSPDGDKDKDPLLINLMDEGQEIISNLRHLNLNPQVCYRDSEPINLYHKVGHGTLDMYVLSPAKDSKEVREFLQKWNQSDQKLFANSKSSREFSFPIQNLISIAALLVWQPANPNDTITRILFPGSSPQRKIFEGLDRLKNLEFIKHPVCTDKSLVPSSIVRKAAKDSIIEKVISKEKVPAEKKDSKIIENNVSVNGEIKEKIVKKSDSTESERSTKTKKTEEKIIENGEKPKAKPKPSKIKADIQHKRKTVEKKSSPTTPKKTVENGEAKKPTKPSPIGTPAKSTKDANNRKVIESKTRSAKPPPAEPKPKVERKPISRRPKGTMKAPISPVKKLVNGVQKPDSISKKGKLDKEGTTDSSTVSTPSADQESLLKKDISKLTPEEIQQMKAQELADLKEEQEAVKEIEAVFRKGEGQSGKDENLRKVKDISIDEDKLEKEEYLIIEKEEIDHDSLDEKETKEDETQKLARDSEESEKQRKLSTEEQIMEKQHEIEEQVNNIVTEAEDIVKAKEDTEVSKEAVITSPEEKLDVSSTDKKTTDKEIEEEIKDVVESQPDEKVSANIKSGDTTTAPTLPEDERIPLDEIKEDSGQMIEEKHVKEETKEKEVPVIQLPPKTFETISKVPGVVGIRLDKQSHIRDIVKTPDEVADLPVHEEVDYEYTHELKAETKTNEIIEDKKDVKPDDQVKELITDAKETVGYIKEQTKEIEQEKDKDEIMQDQLQEIINDSSKTSVMQEELKKLRDAVEESASALEKDILKDIETPVKEMDEQPKKIVEDRLKNEDIIAERQETEKDVPKEELKYIESQPTEDIFEKADLEKKEKLDTKEESDKIEITEKEELEKPKADIKETAEKVEESKQIDKQETMKTEQEKDTTKEEDTTKLEKTSEHEQSQEIINDIIKDEQIAHKDEHEVREDEKEVVDIRKQGKEKAVEEKLEEKEIFENELKEEEEFVKETAVKVESTKQELHEDKLEEPLVNGEILEEEFEKKVLKDKIVDSTDAHSKLEKSDESKEETKTKSDEKRDAEKEAEIKEKADLEPEKKIEELPSVEEVKTEIIKQKEEIIKATKEDKAQLEKIDGKLQHLKEISPEPKIETIEPKELEDVPKTEQSTLIKATKAGKDQLEKLEEKLLELKAAELKFEVKHDADTIIEEEEEKDQKLAGDIIEKAELGRKSPKEREEDVIKIVASVAEVLKSDAPLEEFEGKLPISTFTPFTTTYTTELRETHITTVDSPIVESKVIKIGDIPTIPEEPSSATASFLEEERKIVPVHEGEPDKDDKRSSLLKESQELMMATSKMISEIKSAKGEEKEETDESGIVHRMLVTASSEDGGEEIEICPVGTITFSKSSESSGRSSPEKSQDVSKKSSIVDTTSDSLSTVKQVIELHSEKDSGIDDVKSDTDLESQEKLGSPPDAEVAKTTAKETGSISPFDKSEEMISQTVSGKSSPDKDASIKSLASGKSTPDISDFEKSKEVTPSVDDLKKSGDSLKKDSGADLAIEGEASLKEISKEEKKDEEKDVDSTYKETPKTDIVDEEDKVEVTEIAIKETSTADEVQPEVKVKEKEAERRDSLIDKLEDTIIDKLGAVSDFTKSLFSKGEEEIEEESEDIEVKEVTSEEIKKEDKTAEPMQTAEESYVEKMEDKIKETLEKIYDALPSFLEHGGKESVEVPHAGEDAMETKEFIAGKTEAIEKPVDKLDGVLEEATKSLADKLQETSKDTVGSLSDKIDETADKVLVAKDTLNDKAAESAKTTSDTTSKATEEMEDQSTKLEDTFKAIIDNTADAISDILKKTETDTVVAKTDQKDTVKVDAGKTSDIVENGEADKISEVTVTVKEEAITDDSTKTKIAHKLEDTPKVADKESESADERKHIGSEDSITATKTESSDGTKVATHISADKVDAAISQAEETKSDLTDAADKLQDSSKGTADSLDKGTNGKETSEAIVHSLEKSSDILDRDIKTTTPTVAGETVKDKVEEIVKSTVDTLDDKYQTLEKHVAESTADAKDKVDEIVKATAHVLDTAPDTLKREVKESIIHAKEDIEITKDSVLGKVEESVKVTADSSTKALEKEIIDTAPKAEEDKDADKEKMTTDIIDATKQVVEDEPSEEVDLIIEKTKKRRESLVEQFEEGVKSTFSALAGFGKSLFDKGEKVIEDTASKAEPVLEDLKTTTGSIVEKLEEDIKSSIATAQDFEKSLLQSDDKAEKAKEIDIKKDSSEDFTHDDKIDTKKVDKDEKIEESHTIIKDSKPTEFSEETVPSAKLQHEVKEILPTETKEDIKVVDQKDIKEEQIPIGDAHKETVIGSVSEGVKAEIAELKSEKPTSDLKSKDEEVKEKTGVSGDSKDAHAIDVSEKTSVEKEVIDKEFKEDTDSKSLTDGKSTPDLKKSSDSDVKHDILRDSKTPVISGKSSPDLRSDKKELPELQVETLQEGISSPEKADTSDVKHSKTEEKTEIKEERRDSISHTIHKAADKDITDIKSEIKEDLHKDIDDDKDKSHDKKDQAKEDSKSPIKSEAQDVHTKMLPEEDLHKDSVDRKEVTDTSDQLPGIDGKKTPELPAKTSSDIKTEDKDIRKLSTSDITEAKSPSLSGKSTPEVKDVDETADKKDTKFSEPLPIVSTGIKDITSTTECSTKATELDIKEPKPVEDLPKSDESKEQKDTDKTIELEQPLDLAKSLTFDKCGISTDLEEIDPNILKEEETTLKKSAEDLEQTYDTVTKLSKSLSFEKCEKPEDINLKKEEKALEGRAEELEETFETLTGMAKSVVFEKCEPTEGTDPAVIEKEEIALEKSAEGLEDAYDTVSKLSKSLTFEKCEKPEDIVLKKEEKALESRADELKETFETVTDMSKSIVFEKCEPTEEIDPEVIEKEEIALKKSAEGLEDAYDTVSKLSKSLSFEKCEKPEDIILKKEEKALEDCAEELEETFETVTDMSKSIVFEKCEPTEEIDPEVIEKEEIAIEKSAEALEDAYDTVSKLSKSLSFEKCEKPDDKILQKEEKALEDRAEELKQTFETVTDMSKSIVFEKCEPTEAIDPKLLEKEEAALEKAAEGLEDAYDTVSKLTKSLSFEKCEKSEEKSLHKEEKALEDRAEELKETCETVTDMSRSVLFEKHEPTRKKSLAEELVEDLKEAFHAVSDRAKSTIAETFEYEEHKEKTDAEKELYDEKSTPELHASDAVVKDILKKVTSDIDTTSIEAEFRPLKGKTVASELKAKVDDKEVKHTGTDDIDTKSIEAELKKSIEQVKDNKLQESTTKSVADITTTVEKCEKETMEKAISKSGDSKGEIKETVGATTGSNISDDKELKDLDSKETLPPLEKEIIKEDTKTLESRLGEKEILEPKLEKSTLDIAQAESKKLSISDVEISLADAKVITAEALVCLKYTSTKLIEAERRLSSDRKTEKGDIKDDKQKTESKDIEDSCDKAKESFVSEKIPVSIAGPSTLEKTKDLSETEIEKQRELQDTLLHEKHIPGSVTPPTVPVSPNVIDSYSDDIKLTSRTETLIKEMGLRSGTPGSDDFEIVTSTQSDISSKMPLDSEKLDSDEEDQLSVTSQVAHSRDSSHYDLEEDTRIGAKIDPMSMSFYGALPDDESVELCEKEAEPSYLYEITKAKFTSSASADKADGKEPEGEIGEVTLPSGSAEKKDPIESWGKPLGLPAPPTYLYEITKAKYTTKALCVGAGEESYGSNEFAEEKLTYLYEATKAKHSAPLSDDEDDLDHINQNEQVQNLMTASFYGDFPSSFGDDKDPIASWGKPLGLPSPAPPNDNKGTPKKERRLPPNVTAKNKLNDDKKRSESPSKYKNKKVNPVYVDLTYVPHHGNSYYSYVDFFKRVRARYYVFSGIEPSRDVYNALLEAKQTWEDKELEVTIIPTYDTDILGYWVAENEELLTKFKIDLSPSASRCTINLQDHETSCSAYRLEF